MEMTTEMTNKERKFTIKIGDSYQLELEPELFIKLCVEMPILKQIWFNFNAKYDDILNLENRVFEIESTYRIYQPHFLLIIRMLKDNNNLFIPAEREIEQIHEVLDTLGGCEFIENRLIEIQKQNNKKKKEIEEEDGLCVREPALDKLGLFEWRTLIMNIGRNTEEEMLKSQNQNILKLQEEGYTFSSCNNFIYHFRRKIILE
tara:strand:- start:370 stop:978 length:609 start_codon:yes stop_codon:yes gene_type:complete